MSASYLVPATLVSATDLALTASNSAAGLAAEGVAAADGAVASVALPVVVGASLLGALGYRCCRKRQRPEEKDSGGCGGINASAWGGVDRVTSLESRLARAEERLGRLEESRPAKAARLGLGTVEQPLPLHLEEAIAPQAAAGETGCLMRVLDKQATVDLVEQRLKDLKDDLRQTIDQQFAGVWIRLGEKAHKTDVKRLDGQVSELQGRLEDMADKVEDIDHLDRRVSCLRDRLEEKPSKEWFERVRALHDDSQGNPDAQQPHAAASASSDATSADARRRLAKFPDHISVICERALPEIRAKTLLAPRTMPCRDLEPCLRKHVWEESGVALAPGKPLCFYAGDEPVEADDSMAELYERFKAEDGYLHIRYSADDA